MTESSSSSEDDDNTPLCYLRKRAKVEEVEVVERRPTAVSSSSGSGSGSGGGGGSTGSTSERPDCGKDSPGDDDIDVDERNSGVRRREQRQQGRKQRRPHHEGEAARRAAADPYLRRPPLPAGLGRGGRWSSPRPRGGGRGGFVVVVVVVVVDVDVEEDDTAVLVEWPRWEQRRTCHPQHVRRR
jgi:hypothetical protein